MSSELLAIGDKVRIVSYGPFRGLKGMIRKVNTITHGDESNDSENDLLFYQIDLEGAYIKVPVWFEGDEIAPLSEMRD